MLSARSGRRLQHRRPGCWNRARRKEIPLNDPRSSTTGLAGACLAATLMLGGCASPPPKAERYIPPPMGSTWTYAMHSTGSYGSGDSQMVVQLAESTWEGRTVLAYRTASQHQLQDRHLNLLAFTAPDGKPQMRFDPPVGWDWPMQVGKVTTRDHVATVIATGQKIPFTATWTVEAHEDVTVPAGTFKAWRLRYTDSTGETQLLWSMPETMGVFAKRSLERSPSHRLGAGTRVMELVAVPAVK
jgi:hypothetical protein